MEEFITACPRNCYSTCSFRVQTEGNVIRRILPYSENLATPEGPCIKGLAYIERNNSPDRIIHPLIKAQNGKFQQITAKEALDIISNKLESIRLKHGPQSILWYKGSGMSGLTNEIGNSFWSGFGGATTTYGNICWPAGLEAVRLTLGTVKHNVLLAIDRVYVFADKRASVFLHSGQTFLSGLLIVSFFAGAVLPFIFIALIRFCLSVYKISVNKINSINFGIRFLRIALLLVSGVFLVSEISYNDTFIISLFLAGELIDRFLFYIDFNPLNINLLMKNILM